MITIELLTKPSEEAPSMEWRLVLEPGALRGQVWSRRNSRLKKHQGWQGWVRMGSYGACKFLDVAGRYNRAGWLRKIELKES